MPRDQGVIARRQGLRIALATLLARVPPAHAQERNPAQERDAEREERFRRMSLEAEERGLAAPFKGVTTDGNVVGDLYALRPTGVSTEPVRNAATAFLASLSPAQRAATTFPLDDVEWRRWMNQHFYVRRGTSLGEMTGTQRDAAIGLLRASLSARGLRRSLDIMRLDDTLAELNGGNFDEFGQGRYWMTVMGEPSADQPWGWQIDGHHLVINYFVLGDQVVMTPAFMGAEPVVARAGRHRGTAAMQEEQAKGLALVNALDDAQRRTAVLRTSGHWPMNRAEAFQDNLVLAYAGIRAGDLTPAQRDLLVELVAEYVGNMREEHAEVRMEEVLRHLGETRFAWIGGTGADAIFYYRVHSPVILIEFGHQLPVNMPDLEPGRPTREHAHSVVRTPNGNDYGRELLRQHHRRSSAPHTR